MDDDPELEAIRQRRLQEMQQNQAAQEQQAKQIEAQKQSILRQIMSPEARDRLANVKLANPQLAASVENQLIRLYQSGRLQQEISDAMLREILQSMVPQHREIKIERR